MAGPADQDDPGTAVAGAAVLRLIEHGGHHLRGSVVHRAAQPLRPGLRPLAALGRRVVGGVVLPVGVGDDVVDRVWRGFRIVDGSQGGHPFPAVLLAGRQPGLHRVAALGRRGFRGVLAQRFGPYHHAFAVDRQDQRRGVGAGSRHEGVAEGVDVPCGADSEFLDLPVPDAGAGDGVDPFAGAGEAAAGGLDRGKPGQPMRVHCVRQVQRRVGRAQVRHAGAAVGDPDHGDLAEHRGQPPVPVPLDPGAPGTGGVHDLNTGVLKAEAAVDGWYPLLTSVPAGQADAGHALIPLEVLAEGSRCGTVGMEVIPCFVGCDHGAAEAVGGQ
ncbi:hypothetical protein Sipo8835_12470 [Streptomyces ipomoeae]|uniref:Uncharacterized protein n=1 Tax=Streptomyces ipomoeae TaxID=103232 RepID=A0AAE8W3R6_9ACTN|nr:hypothetical protein Sipo8835_12470 [Streptomyces ipomoeae]